MPASTRPVALIIAAAVLTAALAVGLWAGGWWLREDAINRRTRIDRRSNAFVQSRIDRARDDVIEVAGMSDGAQRFAIVRGICESLADIPAESTPSDLAQFGAINC